MRSGVDRPRTQAAYRGLMTGRPAPSTGTPPGDPDHAGTARRRPVRTHRLRNRVIVVSGVGLIAGLLALAVLWQLTPSVADLEHRIGLRLAAHGASDPHALPRPDRVAEALVATEDSRFYSHHGIDILGVARAVSGPLRGQGDPGGATLDQQLAKVIYTPEASGPAAKVEQMVLALKLDARYSKTQILEAYLSSVYFGNGFYGLPAASRGYFGLAPADLSWGQASLMAGLVQAPSAYNPQRHLSLARQRQRHVLDRLVATRHLSAAQASAAYAEALRLI